MKIKRFLAPDMRQAMRDVRTEQGADAVILSTRRLEEGIEIIAAVDYDEALMREAVRVNTPPTAAPAPAPAPSKPPVKEAVKETPKERLKEIAREASKEPAKETRAAIPPPPPPPPMPLPTTELAALQPMIEQHALETARMRTELGGLRQLLEQQLSSLAWNDMERRSPMRARVLRDMSRLGIDTDVARQLIDELPEEINADQARYLPLGLLSRSLKVSGRGLADVCGVTALVGPTGVGKTTTIAKLAACAVMHHGPNKVALVSTDHYRIGAAAQLEHYGRLLGVRVYPAYDAVGLAQTLHLLRDHHTVLVDTAGVGGNDPRLQQQMDVLREATAHGAASLRAGLVLAANAQASALDDSVRAYLPLKPSVCIATKLDEAPSLGGLLSVLIRHRIPLDCTTDGQRVPEDISAADARVLVCRAAQQQRKLGFGGDDLDMAERFGMAVAGL
ncbi:flagellar biosynthesis protein FlhF [Dyella nitratireducens]|uniref:Flagellar biosynthesis protein FlhF n=1 Tax=Dyella nitratireducens TaxID=1849580 RepID=A0ABQ1FR34_9GAMM|nr:flagellar biosynthesis protein FlhF [Dyella nitratireducens]GGA27456.1 flagellar biosynthesis protein FlhF [Dyella nitratireducens]GLQ43411.1 flagellar biosynthesis protein FlhF [Dyella nitratireducens]